MCVGCPTGRRLARFAWTRDERWAGSDVRVSERYVLPPLLFLAAAEAVVFVTAPGLAVWMLGERFFSEFTLALVCLVFGGSVVIGFTAMGLYSRRQRSRLLGILLRTVAAVLAAVAAVALASYLFPDIALGRGALALAAAMALAASAVGRFVVDRFVDPDTFKRRVLVYGASRRAQSIAQLRRRADQRGFSIVGFVCAEEERPLVDSAKALTLDRSLLAYCVAHEIDEVVVAMDDRRRAFPVHELLECRLNGIQVIDVVDFLERETGKLRLDVLNPSWIIFAPGFDRSRWRGVSKRTLDVTAGLALFAVAWPFMLAAVLAIKLEDGLTARVLYRQRRAGLDGRPFDVLKFRSMRVDAERGGRPVWAQKGDPRVTRVGAFIRKVRIDELPQILNVLRGDMSFVGPRPERPEFVVDLEEKIPYYHERHCVKPGITGWAQLCYPYGASEQDAVEKLQYDLYYVKNHSLIFDIMILLQTVEVVLWGQGAR